MHLNEIRYEQLKNDAMASGAFKRASERGENITLDTSKSADPIPENVAAYNTAYAEYNKVLDQVAPLYV